jgi:hypothetical protein
MEKEKTFPQELHLRVPHLRASLSTATTIADTKLFTVAFGVTEPFAKAWTHPEKK